MSLKPSTPTTHVRGLLAQNVRVFLLGLVAHSQATVCVGTQAECSDFAKQIAISGGKSTCESLAIAVNPPRSLRFATPTVLCGVEDCLPDKCSIRNRHILEQRCQTGSEQDGTYVLGGIQG